MKLSSILLILSLVFISKLSAQEYSISTIPDVRKESAEHYVSNPDGILSKDMENKINKLLLSLEQKSSVEIDVVLVNAVDSEDLDSFTNELFNYWGIGKKGKDNGMLLLFVLNKRFLRFETGYGLEGVLPDAICKRIQTELMFPEFKKGNYNEGIILGIQQIINYLTKPEAIEEVYARKQQNPWYILSFYTYLFIYLLVSIIIAICTIAIIYFLRKNKMSNYQYYMDLNSLKKLLRFFIFIFPITLIPILIWIRSKLRYLRNTPIPCSECGELMSSDSNKELIRDHNNEPMDYDIWKCDSCHKILALVYKGSNILSSICPQCTADTLLPRSSKTIYSATLTTTGSILIRYSCLICKYEHEKYLVIPRILRKTELLSPIKHIERRNQPINQPKRNELTRNNESNPRGQRGGGQSGGGGASGHW